MDSKLVKLYKQLELTADDITFESPSINELLKLQYED